MISITLLLLASRRTRSRYGRGLTAEGASLALSAAEILVGELMGETRVGII